MTTHDKLIDCLRILREAKRLAIKDVSELELGGLAVAYLMELPDEYLVEPKEEEEMGCSGCGDKTVMIRGKHPHDPRREACPTCLQEKMDMIREMADPSYGVAYTDKKL